MSVPVLDAAAEREFRNFVRAATPPLMRAAYLLTGDSHHAQDLLQSTFAGVALHWRTASQSPHAYARRALYHQAVSWWRWRGRRPESLPGLLPERIAESDDEDRRLVVQAALKKLTSKQRAVLVLRYFEDLSEPDTAAVLGCSVGTVKSQTRHALSRLRALAPELADLLHPVEVES